MMGSKLPHLCNLTVINYGYYQKNDTAKQNITMTFHEIHPLIVNDHYAKFNEDQKQFIVINEPKR